MNRKQRRDKSSANIEAQLVKAWEDKIKQTSVHFTVSAYSVAVATVLHDKFGFGEVRLKRAMAHIEDTFDSINKGYAKIDDLKKVILDECKVNIK